MKAGFFAIALLAGLVGWPAPESQDPSAPTFAKDIAPLIFDRCGMCHHDGGPAPFSLLTYAGVKRHATQIAAVTKSRFMPPWKVEPGSGEFIGQRPLNDAEIGLIQRWVSAGTPQGNERDLPPSPRWTDGWQLGKPDLIVTPTGSYSLQPDGTDVFRIFTIPLPIDATRYVRGIEFRPGHARVVHHANIRVDRTPASRRLDEQDPAAGYDGLMARSAEYPGGHFLGWTPGQVAPLVAKDLAWRLDPGTDLVVQLHMQPDGKPEVVQPSIGVFFGGEPPVRTPAILRLGSQGIDIPAGDASYTIADSYVLPVDVQVLAIQPHAHYRAKEMTGFARLPDGSEKPLIHIRDWDFRWQHVYRYVKPLSLPKGTTVAMRYRYDNSPANPRNPLQPPQRALWGQRSRDEMGDLWLQVLTRDDRDLAILNRGFQPKMLAEDVVGYETMIRANPEDVDLHDDVALLYLQLGQTEKAVSHFQASVDRRPRSAAAHFNLGTALTVAKRFDEAVREYQTALEIKPDYAAAHNNLGNVLEAQGKMDEAARHYAAALRTDAENAEARYSMGRFLERRGDRQEAVRHLREAVRLRPASAPGLAALAWLLATAPEHALRDPGQAVRFAEQAAGLTERRDAVVLDVLGAAYAAAGQFDRASEATGAALRLAPSEPLATEVRNRQNLYERRKPYIAPRH